MRILFRLVTSSARQNNRTSILCDRVTYRRKVWFRSISRTLLLLGCVPTASRLSFGFYLPNSIAFYSTFSSAAASIHRTFQSTAITTTAMVDDDNVDDNAISKPKTRKRRSAAAAKSDVGSESPDIDEEPKKTRRSASSKATSTLNSRETKDVGATGEIIVPAVLPPKKVKPPAHQVITEKDEIPKLWNSEKAAANGSYTFRVASWNVAGLRAVLAKTPNVFADLVKRHNIDILCLQETKLQEQHLDDPKLNIKQAMGLYNEYDAYWSCSTAKKGYSGTAVFVRRRKNSNIGTLLTNSDASNNVKSKSSKKQTSMLQFVKSKTNEVQSTVQDISGKDDEIQDEVLPIDIHQLIPTSIAYAMDKEKHDMEGRLIVVDYPSFTLCNVYVPNAGQQLERLSYRVNEWDKDFLHFVHQKRKDRDGLPIVWLGDLNVAHTNLEVWNDGAKHLAKQAGVTAEERASFQEQLDSGHIDAFRHLHPTAAGHYSYWSMRAGNRAVNKGLRLDYFICDPKLFDETSHVIVRDCYMDATQEGSDHCPVILEMEIKGANA